MLNKNRPILCIAFLAVAILSISNATEVSSISPSESYSFQINNFKFNDLHIGKKYNYFQTDQRIFMMDSNMTIANFVEISIPDIIFAQQNCTKFTFHSAELYSLSACKDLSDNTTYLVMTSFLSSRPFYAYSLKTDLKEVVSMKLSGSVLVVQDQAETTGVSSKTHLFRVNLGGSITSKAMELIAHADAKTLGEIEVAVKEFVTQQSSLMSYGKGFEGKTFAVDCSQNTSFCKAFVSNSAQNSVDVYRVERIYSLSISHSSSAAVNLPNTTFREWFLLFLVILGCLAVLARCTSKRNGNTESEVAREQVVTVVESSSTTNYRLVDNKDASLVSTPIARA